MGHSSQEADAARALSRGVNTTTHERHAGVQLTLICDPCRAQTQRAAPFARPLAHTAIAERASLIDYSPEPSSSKTDAPAITAS